MPWNFYAKGQADLWRKQSTCSERGLADFVGDGSQPPLGRRGTLRLLEAGIGYFREGGFSIEAAAHAISTVESYVHGFVLQEVNLPFRNESELTAITSAIMDQFPRADFPHLFELTTEHVLQPGRLPGQPSASQYPAKPAMGNTQPILGGVVQLSGALRPHGSGASHLDGVLEPGGVRFGE